MPDQPSERPPRLIGYARSSRPEQNIKSQIAALIRAGVKAKNVYSDKASGAKADRPGLAQALAAAERGDTIVVWKLDRLGRKLLNILELARELDARGIQLRSITQDINPSSVSGRLVFHVFAMLAEVERDLIRERTLEGLAHARAQGKHCGRKPMAPEEWAQRRAQVWQLIDKGMTMVQIAKELRAARSTVYSWRDSPAEVTPMSACEPAGVTSPAPIPLWCLMPQSHLVPASRSEQNADPLHLPLL